MKTTIFAIIAVAATAVLCSQSASADEQRGTGTDAVTIDIFGIDPHAPDVRVINGAALQSSPGKGNLRQQRRGGSSHNVRVRPMKKLKDMIN